MAEFDRKGRDELTLREIRASHFAKEPPSRLGHWKYRRVVSAPRQGRRNLGNAAPRLDHGIANFSLPGRETLGIPEPDPSDR